MSIPGKPAFYLCRHEPLRRHYRPAEARAEGPSADEYGQTRRPIRPLRRPVRDGRGYRGRKNRNRNEVGEMKKKHYLCTRIRRRGTSFEGMTTLSRQLDPSLIEKSLPGGFCFFTTTDVIQYVFFFGFLKTNQKAASLPF